MIADPQVFADEHVPEHLQHRESEVGVLARAFQAALAGERPDDVLVYGPHGVGKTVTIRHTFERLEKQADVDWAHIECMGKSTAGIVRAVLQALGIDRPRTTPQEDLCLALRERVDRPLVVVLDEGDELATTDALSRLADVPLVGLVPVVHDPDDLLAHLDDGRVRSRLLGTELGLDRYGVDELADILRPRVQEGLGVAVDDTYLRRIADVAGGVAREAIQTLRMAAEIAAGEARPIEGVTVRVAYERAQTRIRRHTLASMPLHHQVCYAIVWEADDLATSAFNDRYEAVATTVYGGTDRTPIGKRDRRNKLRKLDRYDLVEWADGRVRTVDRGVQPQVDISATGVEVGQ